MLTDSNRCSLKIVCKEITAHISMTNYCLFPDGFGNYLDLQKKEADIFFSIYFKLTYYLFRNELYSLSFFLYILSFNHVLYLIHDHSHS